MALAVSILKGEVVGRGGDRVAERRLTSTRRGKRQEGMTARWRAAGRRRLSALLDPEVEERPSGLLGHKGQLGRMARVGLAWLKNMEKIGDGLPRKIGLKMIFLPIGELEYWVAEIQFEI
jgi:hypothetical protein